VALKKTASEGDARLRIHFIRSETNYGETAPHVDPRTRAIVGADVGIRAEAPGDLLNQRIVIYMTALHELGHALGLRHSDDFGAIDVSLPGTGRRRALFHGIAGVSLRGGHRHADGDGNFGGRPPGSADAL
jgi:hypothetical protein